NANPRHLDLSNRNLYANDPVGRDYRLYLETHSKPYLGNLARFPRTLRTRQLSQAMAWSGVHCTHNTLAYFSLAECWDPDDPLSGSAGSNTGRLCGSRKGRWRRAMENLLEDQVPADFAHGRVGCRLDVCRQFQRVRIDLCDSRGYRWT